MDITVLKQYLDIGHDGRIRVIGSNAQQELLSRKGRFAILKTGDDTILLRRMLPIRSAGDLPPGRIFLSGELTPSQPAVNMINYIYNSRLTCWAMFLSGPIHKALVFRDGQLVGTRSNLLEDRLGEILVRYGVIQPRQLAQVLTNLPPGRQIGAHLLEENLIDGQSLWNGIRRQMEEVFFSVLALSAGSFVLVDAETSSFPNSVSLDAQLLLLEGLQRTDEMAHFRERLPSRNTTVKRREAATLPPRCLDMRGQEIFDLLKEGPDTIGYLSRRSNLGEYITTRAVHCLLEAGCVDVVTKGIPCADDHLGIISQYNKAFIAVYKSLEPKRTAAVSMERALRSFVKIDHKHQPFGSMSFKKDGSLDSQTLLDASKDGKLKLPDDLQSLLRYVVDFACESLGRVEELILWVKLNDIL